MIRGIYLYYKNILGGIILGIPNYFSFLFAKGVSADGIESSTALL